MLDALTKDPVERGLSELSRDLEIPSASLWGILRVLVDQPYVILDKKRRTYRLGFKLMYMSNLLLKASGDHPGFRICHRIDHAISTINEP